MNQIPERTLKQMVDVIVDEIHPEKIILFGSHAKGEAHSGSDIDFLIIDDKPFTQERSRRKEMARIWKALREFMLPVDLLLYSQNEVEERKKSINHVTSHALKEGKIVYERP